MDPNQSTPPESHSDAGSHLQFQISLLRLMSQKTSQKTSRKLMGPKRGEGAGSKVEPSIAASSIQVRELERLQHARPTSFRLQTDR